MNPVKKFCIALSAITLWFALPSVSANAIAIGQSCDKTALGTRVTIRVSGKPVIAVCRKVSGRKKWIRTAVQTPTTTTTSTSTTTTSTTAPAPVVNYSVSIDHSDPTLHTITIEGQQPRTFILNVPPSYSKSIPVPILFGLHGRTGSARQFISDSGINGFADAMGFITVFVNGAGDPIPSWNAGDCCSPASEQGIDDVKTINNILDYLEKNFSIDSKNIWSVGFSNGGMLSYKLACDLSEKFTAIGVGGAALVEPNCSPQKPISLIHLHGQLDETVPIAGGGKLNTPNALESAFRLNAAFLCSGPSKDADSEYDSIHYTWKCPSDAETEFVNYLGAGHGWNLIWTKTILRFLFAHPRK